MITSPQLQLCFHEKYRIKFLLEKLTIETIETYNSILIPTIRCNFVKNHLNYNKLVIFIKVDNSLRNFLKKTYKRACKLICSYLIFKICRKQIAHKF